jgi:hypothetical protein
MYIYIYIYILFFCFFCFVVGVNAYNDNMYIYVYMCVFVVLYMDGQHWTAIMFCVFHNQTRPRFIVLILLYGPMLLIPDSDHVFPLMLLLHSYIASIIVLCFCCNPCRHIFCLSHSTFVHRLNYCSSFATHVDTYSV